MTGETGPTWQTCLWASLGCYSLFYVITNVLTERFIGSPKPPGSGLPVFLLGYFLVVVVIGYWVLLGYRVEFAAHTPGQLAVTLLGGATAGAGLVFFILAANGAGGDASRQGTIVGISALAPVLALLVLFALDVWHEGANAKHVTMRIVGGALAILGGVLLAVYSER